MSLLNNLICLSKINVDIFKNTQVHINFFIKSERCFTLIKHGTSIIHHNHHHANTNFKYLQKQHKIFKFLKLNKSRKIILFNLQPILKSNICRTYFNFISKATKYQLTNIQLIKSPKLNKSRTSNIQALQNTTNDTNTESSTNLKV
jgi:hypothetical protein